MSTYEGFNSAVSVGLAFYFEKKAKAIHTYRRREKRRQRIAGAVA